MKNEILKERKMSMEQVLAEMKKIKDDVGSLTAEQVIEEYKINVSVLDKNGTIIPNDKLNDFLSASIIEQSRPPKDTIIEGITLKVKILATYELESSSSSDEETE